MFSIHPSMWDFSSSIFFAICAMVICSIQPPHCYDDKNRIYFLDLSRTSNKYQEMSLKVVILIGGETTGTRFRPLSMDTPKVLFPIAGKPLISHIVQKIAELGEGELIEVFLLGYFTDLKPFDEYIAEAKKEYSNVNIKYLTEPYSMGTGGGLYYFRDEIFGDGTCEELLVIHGDIVCNYPFKELIQFYKKSNADSVIMGINPLLLMNNYQNKTQIQNHTPFKVYDNIDTFSKYGTIIANKSDSKIVHYVEKPSSKFSEFQLQTEYNTLINGGVYVFDKSILEFLAKAQSHKSSKCKEYDRHNLDNESINSNVLSLELDVLKFLPEAKNRFLTYKSDSFWNQLKTPISALFANIFFLEEYKKNHVCNPLATPSDKVISPVRASNFVTTSENYIIGPNVSLGRNVKIGNGVRIKNCIISDNVTIGDNSFVANAIISKDVKIGRWCRIEGTFTNDTTSKDINQVRSDGYYKLINNIVVLCQNTVVHNQVFVYNSIVLPHKELKNDVKYEIIM
ncbi:DEHA2E15862p [Debaryomyces hansenii CBS767]|uniref:mannose-1-phosphate guanylyltransferase n=1 Tax=Debaryomyces hansenii (strain ATCC 36239 / CBS 767 / BCRC 21394 / JCM 1990 / NBRC 0083 / IGC 2968) TaxID=284592 RepID=Q6BP79_DEBHA|nr:DEHA2E15862p [Debaryomyces hansenii CBS767]CAG88244.2 DEHA2E15862p [Debaryomyces hansenii CBS767]|eukprot:XP_459991.2 DEHA2E15862p [Debaryomyces hansenii CBS767]